MLSGIDELLDVAIDVPIAIQKRWSARVDGGQAPSRIETSRGLEDLRVLIEEGGPLLLSLGEGAEGEEQAKAYG